MPRDSLKWDVEIFWPKDIASKDITLESIWNWIYMLFFEWIPAFSYNIFLDVEKTWNRDIYLRLEIDLPNENLESIWLTNFTILHIWRLGWKDLPNFKPILSNKWRIFIEDILETLLSDKSFDDWFTESVKWEVIEITKVK